MKTTMNTNNNNSNKKEINNLRTIAQIPSHLAFNKYIIKGYRVNYSFPECLKSLLQLHNETINIYTHASMALYLIFTLQWPGFTFPLLSFNNLLTLHSIANILPFTASTIYHLFMCHKHGPGIYHKLLSFDMIGVWAVNTFGYVIAIIATFKCFQTLQLFTLAIYLSMSSVALYYLITAKNASQRFAPLSFYALSRPLILLARLYINYLQLHTDHLGVRFYVFMDTVAMLGAVINVFKFPERFLPGCLDFAINSHQIMHLCTMASIFCLTKAAELDIEFLRACRC